MKYFSFNISSSKICEIFLVLILVTNIKTKNISQILLKLKLKVFGNVTKAITKTKIRSLTKTTLLEMPIQHNLQLFMCNSTAIQDILVDVLFNGLLAELFTILDSFSLIPEVLIWGWWVTTKWQATGKKLKH